MSYNNNFKKGKEKNDVEISPIEIDLDLNICESEIEITSISKENNNVETIYIKNELLSIYATNKGLIESVIKRLGLNIDNPMYLKSIKDLLQLNMELLEKFNNLNIKLSENNLVESKTVTKSLKGTQDFIDKKREELQQMKDKNNEQNNEQIR